MKILYRVWNGADMIEDVTVGKFGAFYVNPGAKKNGLDPNDSASLTPFNTKYPDTCPVMQYSDTHDKNGKRVCEGDIVHVSRQIVHVEPQYADEWHYADDRHKAYMLENKQVIIADYEEIGVVKRNPTRWALSPYVAKTVSFENSQVNEKWVLASKSRPLRVNRGLWIVEVIGNIYETPELYTNAAQNT